MAGHADGDAVPDAGAVPQVNGEIIVTTLDATALEQDHVSSIRDLQRVVPSFSIQRAQQAANTRLAIRDCCSQRHGQTGLHAVQHDT